MESVGFILLLSWRMLPKTTIWNKVLTSLFNVFVEDTGRIEFIALSFYYEFIYQNHLLEYVHRIKIRIAFHLNMA